MCVCIGTYLKFFSKLRRVFVISKSKENYLRLEVDVNSRCKSCCFLGSVLLIGSSTFKDPFQRHGRTNGAFTIHTECSRAVSVDLVNCTQIF